jgi:hypothetical protein
MIYELVLLSMPIFWILLCIPVLLLSIVSNFDHDDCPGFHVLILAVSAIFFFGFTNALPSLIAIHWKYWLFGIAGYVLLGIGYSLWKFYRKCLKEYAKFLKAKSDFIPSQTFKTLEIWVVENKSRYVPKPSENKVYITEWMCFWVFCLIHDVLKLSLIDLWNMFYEILVGVFARISSHFANKMK